MQEMRSVGSGGERGAQRAVGGERRAERSGGGGEEGVGLQEVGGVANAAAFAAAGVEDGGDVGEDGGLVAHAGVEGTVRSGRHRRVQGGGGIVGGRDRDGGDWGGGEERRNTALGTLLVAGGSMDGGIGSGKKTMDRKGALRWSAPIVCTVVVV